MPESKKINVVTKSGQQIEVLVTSFKADETWVLLGEGPHSSKCKLEPPRNGLAYAGSVMGREIIYQRSVQDVRQELAGKVQHGGGFRR